MPTITTRQALINLLNRIGDACLEKNDTPESTELWWPGDDWQATPEELEELKNDDYQSYPSFQLAVIHGDAAITGISQMRNGDYPNVLMQFMELLMHLAVLRVANVDIKLLPRENQIFIDVFAIEDIDDDGPNPRYLVGRFAYDPALERITVRV